MSDGVEAQVGSFDDVKKVARSGSTEACSPATHRTDNFDEDQPFKKKMWRKSLDPSQAHRSGRLRTGSWNLGKERSEPTRKTRTDMPSIVSNTGRDEGSDTVSRVTRSGSLPAEKVSDADTWESLEREARLLASDAEDDEEETQLVVSRRHTDMVGTDSERQQSGGEGDGKSVPTVQIRSDAKTRVKHRKNRSGAKGRAHLELDLSALLLEKPEELDSQVEAESLSPKRKVGRTAGGGFLSARGLDSIQIRKKSFASNTSGKSLTSREVPKRHTSSPIEEKDTINDPLQKASWETASDEVLERRAVKRERVLMELLSTERKFVSVLEAVVEFVLAPMRTNGILPMEDVDTIFSNIEEILCLNEGLLIGMESCLGKKRRRTASKLSRIPSASLDRTSPHIPPIEALPNPTLEKLAASFSVLSSPGAGRMSSTDPVGLRGSPRQAPPPPPRTPSPSSDRSLTPRSPRTPSAPHSPRTPSPRTPSSGTPTSPRRPRSPPNRPVSPSQVDGRSIPSLIETAALLASPAPSSPAPIVPITEEFSKGSWVHQCTSLGSLFLEYSKRMSIHTQFCSNHSSLLAEKKLKKMREENPALSRFLETCLLRPECQGQTLEAMLITIPQRVCRYPMLLLELIKNTSPSAPDYDLIVQAWRSVRDVVAEINAQTEVASDFGALLDVQQVLQIPPGLGITLLHPLRKFVTRGVFKVSKTCNYAFLFNDCLILARSKGEFFKAKRVIKLSKLILRDTGPGGQPIKAGSYTIQLAEIGERIINVEFSMQQEMEQWAKHLRAAMANCASLHAADETVSRMSTTHALASTMANLVMPLSPRGILGGGSPADFQKKRTVPKRPKKTKHRTMPRSLVMNGLNSPSSPAVLDKGTAAELEKEVRRRRAAEAKVKELEAEIRSLKKQLGEKSMLVGTLQSRLEKDSDTSTKKKRSAFNSTKSASNLLAEFGGALSEASPKKVMARKRREEEQSASALGRDSHLPRIIRGGSMVSFPDPVAAEAASEANSRKGSPVVFARSTSDANGPAGRERLLHSDEVVPTSPGSQLSLEDKALQLQILQDKREHEEREAEKKKKRKHRISVSLLKI